MTTWLITGCSTGLGYALAEAVLAKGDNAVVTARDVSKLDTLVASLPDQALAVELDVTDPGHIAAAVAAGTERFGGIDVLVNNAGYGYRAAVEEGDDDHIRELFETHVFGPVNLIKAVLPQMRARRSGAIVNISSIGARVMPPGSGYYAAVKAALETMTGSLRKELAPLGITALAVEPGGFRTDWAKRSMHESTEPIEAYAADVGARKELIRAFADHLPGNPAKVGEAVVMLAGLEEPPLRLLLGSDVLAATRQKLAEMTASIDEWESVTVDVGFPADS